MRRSTQIKESEYTGIIFEEIDQKEIIRPENYGLTGKYKRRQIKYTINNEKEEAIIEGNFEVLGGGSISSLHFPKETEIVVTKQENYKIEPEPIYPNNRTL